MVGLNIDMPKSCYECVCRSDDSQCPITGVRFPPTFAIKRLISCPLIDLDKKEIKNDH